MYLLRHYNMLQTLENFYLAVLRVTVLLVAGVLLAGSITMAFMGMKALQSDPPVAAPRASTPAPAAVKRHLLQPEKGPAPKAAPTTPTAPANSAKADAARATATIARFVSQHSNGTESVATAELEAMIVNSATPYEEAGQAAVFLKSYADTMEQLLSDPEVIGRVKDDSPIAVVNRIIGIHQRQFEKSSQEAEEQRKRLQDEHMERQAKGQQQIYVAAGALAGFLMVVFLSIAIRVERNLRQLDALAQVSAFMLRQRAV